MPDTTSPKGRLLGSAAVLLIFLVIGTAAYALLSLEHERRHARELAVSNMILNDSLRQLRGELQTMSDKLASLTTHPLPSAARVPETSAHAMPRAATKRAASRASAPDPRWQQMQTRLAEQQKEIAETRQQLDHARREFDGKLNSTRDDLSGSIARNHGELVALEKRGQRNYYEFQIDKSKQFRRVGPLSLSARKVDFKHKRYDLVMMVDDRQLEKKRVNLYEPLLLSLADRPQPIEIVVNDIGKDRIKGYISEPKFKNSELATATATTAPAANDLKGLHPR